MLSRLTRALRSGTMAAPARWHSGHPVPRYRQFPEVTRRQVVQSELISSFMWFWILWHSWHSPDTVLGHFPYPDPLAWTNEELGIPPDDEE
ncbi:PREDICTED: NADH dehydrogenase [ubiquinone] 1 beta subcomplex subunit 2, mitochondrial [Crocodylus porosus]|uniref:NADH dehydrogenase [ubiquinone] 1 beta subcomplex subunit 2, mitochondrial n=1 Tax=Crocodylus porosus TaxID=8502 RepID=UPI0009403848|nr:PREDICTED: NADH dehydrogenase [ubiquinone] 1 beta subcomplex subunit 2, mitochondrial [Crocodylus porosus]